MNRRGFLSLVSAAALIAAGPAHADFVDNVRAQLKAQGYRQVSVSNTLLGRSRVIAKGKGGTREIIMNPRTGEVLRDLWTSSDGKSGPSIGGSEGAPKGNAGGDDNGGDDNGGDDNGGDDNGGGDGDSGDGGSGGDGDGGDGDGGDD